MVGKGPYVYSHSRPALSVDVLLFSLLQDKPRLLLIQRRAEPYKGTWALPGGFVDEHEPLVNAARRELREETGVVDVPLWELGAFGDPGRDPRGWTVSIAFVGLVAADRVHPQAADDATALDWFPLTKLPPLAFDHDEIIDRGRDFLKQHALEMLPSSGLLTEPFRSADLLKILTLLGAKPRNAAWLNELVKSRLLRKAAARQRPARFRFGLELI